MLNFEFFIQKLPAQIDTMYPIENKRSFSRKDAFRGDMCTPGMTLYCRIVLL